MLGDLFFTGRTLDGADRGVCPLSHGVPRVDNRCVVSGIVYVIRNGLQWKDAPKGYGPHKTLYNRFIRWSRLGVFDRIFAGLAGEGPSDFAERPCRHPRIDRACRKIRIRARSWTRILTAVSFGQSLREIQRHIAFIIEVGCPLYPGGCHSL